MPPKRTAILLACLTLQAQPTLKFQGRDVTLTEAKEGAPASICIEWPEQRQCYSTPQGYGRAPHAEPVQISKDLEVLLFTANTEGATDFGIHFALLTKGGGRELQDLFFGTIEASNQSRHALWSEPSISDSRIFVIADYVWGPGEPTHDPHRYMISAYVRTATPAFDLAHYYLRDRYMTSRKYDPASKVDILTAEKPELLSRLKRIR